MHEAVLTMLKRYNLTTQNDYRNALREILQEVALLGLWRIKFFEKAAFYGGTALRILYGLDRYSEDLDFSLLLPDKHFSLAPYGESLKREINSFGFHVEFSQKVKIKETQIESAFLKSNTLQEFVVINTPADLPQNLHPQQSLKIKIEVDTNPPSGFITETRYMLKPLPFSIRILNLPDLFAGKLHAVLCRKWKSRVKGRDWYDLMWYVSNHPYVRLSHLESRMRQTGDYSNKENLTKNMLKEMLHSAVDTLNVEQARKETSVFIKNPQNLAVWSKEFFHDIINRIITI